MRSLIRYLINNYAFLLFILLESISLVFVFNFSNYQKAWYLNSANKVTATVYNAFNTTVNYFRLSHVNEELAEENARLRSVLESTSGVVTEVDSIYQLVDTTLARYHFTAARVINNSVNKPYNYLTLNKGSKQGIKPDQGIVSENGVVGVISRVSESYSLGLSLLNSRWGVSAKLKKSGFFAPVSWDGRDYRIVNLREIPFHVEINIGDTVVTSGYSSIFPEGIMIGTIQSFSRPEGENYYQIDIKLSTNFKQLTFVDIVNNLESDKINNLESTIEDGTVSD